MENNRIIELLGEIGDCGGILPDEHIEAIREAIKIVREKPNTRTIKEVQSIVDAVRAGIDVQIEHHDPDLEAAGGYEISHLPTY